jgi:DNA-binding transcriptional ArsR family regulator
MSARRSEESPPAAVVAWAGDPLAPGAKSGGGGEASGLTGYEAELVAVFADLVVLLGLPKSFGEIYGLLFASAHPPTFADIERKLGLSKGSVSQGLRALRELGAVREAAAGGSAESSGGAAASARAVRWVATTELRTLLGSLLRERLTPYLERQDQRLVAAENTLSADAPGADAATHRVLRARLDKLQAWHSRARSVLPLIGKML